MADNKTANCPTCGVPLESLGVSMGSVGEFDRLDDPNLERWDSFRCPRCGGEYRVNNQTGAMKQLPT